MNGYAFIASVVGSLAWPAVVIFFLFFLMRRASFLVRFIKTIKYGDLEISLRDAREAAQAVQIERGTAPPTALTFDDKVLKLAEIDPGVAVLEIWKTLEAKLIQLIQHNGLMRFTRPDHFIRVLFDLKKISATEFDLYQRLRKIRNESVHSRGALSLTPAEVMDFKSFVETFTSRLDQIRAEPDYIDIPESK